MKNSDYYFDLIEGGINPPKSILKKNSDYSEEQQILHFAFDKLEEVFQEKDFSRLIGYLEGEIDEYSSKKFLTLSILGEVSDRRAEEDISKFLYSVNPDLKFIAYCSLCSMLRRSVLSPNMESFVLGKILSVARECMLANEDVVEAAETLKEIGHPEFEMIMDIIKKNRPEIVDDIYRS